MAFKREGNDKGLLENLRGRRIKELFSDNIPDDEAKLLCNGRLACLVCNQNPVFDTVSMLMVHRQGKKHAAADVEFKRKKKELHLLILKRKHEQYMKDGTTNIKQAALTSSHGISRGTPYDPCVKKHKLKTYDRKPKLNLVQPDSVLADCSQQRVFTVLPSRHCPQLKNIFHPGQRQQLPVKPYVSQHRINGGSQKTQTVPSSSGQPLNKDSVNRHFSQTASVEAKLIHLVHSDSSSSSSLKYAGSFCLDSKGTNFLSSPLSRDASISGIKFVSSSQVNTFDIPCTQENSLNGSAKNKQFVLERDQLYYSGANKDTDAANNVGAVIPGINSGVLDSAACDNAKKMAQKYLQLRGSGWKKDWDGKWIRDEEAEFDSDEEEPDLP